MSSQKRKAASLEESPDHSNIYRSEAIEDRSSTFIGYFSFTHKAEDLQKLDEFASASHKILAWRRESNQQAITGGKKYVSGHDDDGEKYGGKKVEKVLESMQVTGACVVARWYGGVLLGPVRFDHIEKCAKDAVRMWQDSEEERRRKRRKEESDARDKAALLDVLKQRDDSVAVLRKLCSEKEDEIKEFEAETMSKKSSDAVETKPATDYTKMTLERLIALEKARDATIAFLLKRIDMAEGKLTIMRNQEEQHPS